jgi:GT2 family glycosyltransferase
MPETPDVSVIICSRNRPSLLLGGVRSVLSGDCVPLEIVVVDQSDVANDAVGEISERVQYVPSKTVGAGRARNIGIRSSRGALLAFIDDDVVVHTTWLGILIDALVQLGPCGVVTGKVRDASPGADTFAPSTREDDDSVVFSGSTFKDVLFTGNMALFRSTINAVGYFDERLGPGTAFPAAEDNDFGLRLLRAGYRLQYVPDAKVDHIGWRSRNEYLPLQWRYGKGQGAYYAKHLSIREPRIAIRLVRDLVRPFLSSVVCIWKKERFGGAFFSVGVGVGCTQWLIHERFGLFNTKQG